MCVKPLIQSSSEAPFTCCGLPTSHHLSARCYPWQATPLHHRWRLHISLYNSSIAEMSRDTKASSRPNTEQFKSPEGVGAAIPRRATARVPTPLYTAPALTLITKRASPATSHCLIITHIFRGRRNSSQSQVRRAPIYRGPRGGEGWDMQTHSSVCPSPPRGPR